MYKRQTELSAKALGNSEQPTTPLKILEQIGRRAAAHLASFVLVLLTNNCTGVYHTRGGTIRQLILLYGATLYAKAACLPYFHQCRAPEQEASAAGTGARNFENQIRIPSYTDDTLVPSYTYFGISEERREPYALGGKWYQKHPALNQSREGLRETRNTMSNLIHVTLSPCG